MVVITYLLYITAVVVIVVTKPTESAPLSPEEILISWELYEAHQEG